MYVGKAVLCEQSMVHKRQSFWLLIVDPVRVAGVSFPAGNTECATGQRVGVVVRLKQSNIIIQLIVESYVT